jgi:hypothetical protein
MRSVLSVNYPHQIWPPLQCIKGNVFTGGADVFADQKKGLLLT